MSRLVILFVLASGGYLFGQNTDPGLRKVEHFEVKARSRLVVLARLGRAARVSLLVEAGDLDFLEQPVTVSLPDQTLSAAINQVLAGPEEYQVVGRGALLLVVPTRPGRALNRLLTLQLGPFTFKAESLSELDPYLGFLIEAATGCNPQGYMWAGPPLKLDIPAFSLPDATFEEVVEDVAKASEPTMWVVTPDSGMGGCLRNASSAWEAGFYNEYSADMDLPFRESAGPEIVK